MVRARFAGLAVVLGCLTVAPIAVAEDSASNVAAQDPASAARALFERGVEALQREAWAEAGDYFERSASLVPRQSTLYNLALSLYHQERHVDALEVIDRLVSSGVPPDSSTRAHAEKLRDRSLGRVLLLDMTVEPPEATIEVDGVVLPRAASSVRRLYLAPGAHGVSVSSPGRAPVRFSVEGRAGQSLARGVALAAVPPVERPPAKPEPSVPPNAAAVPAESPGMPAHWILLGAGSLLLASAAVTGAVAWQADSAFVDACPSLHDCHESDLYLKDRAKSFATVTDVLLGLGVATSGVGAALLIRAESSSNRDRALGLQFVGSL